MSQKTIKVCPMKDCTYQTKPKNKSTLSQQIKTHFKSCHEEVKSPALCKVGNCSKVELSHKALLDHLKLDHKQESEKLYSCKT